MTICDDRIWPTMIYDDLYDSMMAQRRRPAYDLSDDSTCLHGP
jgi:hypothetical protein